MLDLLSGRSPRHMIRYGIHREAVYFTEFRDTYDCVIINGSMAAYSPGALSAFVSSRLSESQGYMIDPQTHAFQHDPKTIQSSATGETKRSLLRLAEHYGEPVSSRVLANKPVQPGDLQEAAAVDGFIERVTTFQRRILEAQSEQDGDSEYIQFAGAQGRLQPSVVIAPYFFMDETNVHSWLGINATCADGTKDYLGDSPVLMQLAVSQGLLYDAMMDDVISASVKTGADAVSLWIDDFDETQVPKAALDRFLQVVAKISEKKPVVIPYGSFFSIALARFRGDLNLVAIGHGLEYGESRAIVPVGGGFPVSKFYYPKVHRRLPYPEALRLALPSLASVDLYKHDVCDCPVCAGLLDSMGPQGFGRYGESRPVRVSGSRRSVTRSMPTTDARNLCVRHYLHCKASEFTRSAEELRATRKQLLTIASRIEEDVGPGNARHLRVWAPLIWGT